ncbi:hypothetical protein N2605_29160 [Bradyrhizobium yuanmingense]|uniref:hypothetical protein n=1 Tax=Bradyrhizobium yuanmingense TaxID=108015 RepID=UPI0021A38EA3|nr:hypothetical protein [Bradyrhizobium sp. CB1024]UWU83545.1 hypothetical protein N2605_29160 [Bradyrhizobium sp. CB1024]
MSTEHKFLAVYLGSTSGSKMAAWRALPEAERKAKEQEGMASWHGWVEKHKSAIVEMGGPLGKTRRIDGSGITEVSNALTGFTVVRAASQEDAAKLFENHPHFAIFPGEAIEVMPVLPIPEM